MINIIIFIVTKAADKNMLIKLINNIKKDIDFKKQQQELKEKVKQKMKREPLIGV